jgi:hypothetical protein
MIPSPDELDNSRCKRVGRGNGVKGWVTGEGRGEDATLSPREVSRETERVNGWLPDGLLPTDKV